jgi:hypothetical protein
MGVSGWSALVFAAAAGLWIASGTQREKARPRGRHSVFARSSVSKAMVVARPSDPRALRELAQAYLDAQAPGLATSLIEHAPTAAVRREPREWNHTYARALLDQGRAEEALTTEHASPGCMRGERR